MPLHAHHLTFSILLFLVPPSLAVIDITTCQQAIATALLQDPSLADNTTIFYQTPASAQNGSLTLFGCEVYCVPGQPRLKSDCGNRLFQWFLPGLLLIVSIATPPVGWWYQVWTSVRPVADPFDAILSVSHRLSVAERCHRDANELVDAWREEGESGPKWDTQRTEQSNPRLQISIALLLYTLPIIAPHLGPKRLLSAVLSSSLLNKTQLTSLIHRTAGRLAEDRTRGVAGAWFTSLSCIAGFVLATVPPLGGSNPSGAMVAASLVLAPLARDVLLGHSVGEVGSNHCVREVLASFLVRCQCTSGNQTDREVLEQLHEALTHGEKEMDTVALVAGTSWYQPLRAMAEEREGRTWTHRTSVALLLADTLTSLAAAAGALAAPPSYLNDRHLLIFGILGGWTLSALMTRLLARSNTNRGNLKRLGLIVAKDMLLAVVIPVLFSMTTCGWLSSCKLWANYYGYGAARARVPLDNTAAFAWNDGVLYPALVGTSFGLNLLTYLVLRWLVYRSAFRVLMWSRSTIGEALWSGKGTTGLDIELQHSNLIAVAVPSVSSSSSTSSQSPNSY